MTCTPNFSNLSSFCKKAHWGYCIHFCFSRIIKSIDKLVNTIDKMFSNDSYVSPNLAKASWNSCFSTIRYFFFPFLKNTSQKMKFSIKDFSGQCDQIRSFLLSWPHLLKKSLMEKFIFCAVKVAYQVVTCQSLWSKGKLRLYYQKQPPEKLCKKGVLGNFAKFTEKYQDSGIIF